MQMFVGGRATESLSGKSVQVVNPATGSVIDTIPAGTADDVAAVVDVAGVDQLKWASISPADKARVLINAGAQIRAEADSLATLLTTEQGKPLRESKDEILGTAHVFEYYASMTGSVRGDAAVLPKYGYMNVVRKPIGICGAIVPWNMPAMIFAWKAGAALACGNAVVAKPSDTAPLTILRLAEILVRAGVFGGAMNVVTGPGSVVGDAIVRNPDIRHVSFTGSVATGRSVALAAAPKLKRLTLELGGNDAFIVAADADIDAAVTGAVRNRFYNCGQVCTSAKRVLVDAKVADEFVRKAKAAIEKLSVGNGLEKVNMGPLNNPIQRDAVASAVDKIVEDQSGTLVCGGRKMDGAGNFYAPTLLTNVAHDAVREEIFGPVMPVILFETLDDAVEIANSTPYGLGASIWTKDITTAYTAADMIRSGVVWVNKHLILPPEIPFGGTKDSGYGRENGTDFIYEFTEPKSILIGI
ncbi:aldehyde dehydrogenase family protein [Methanorbis rubei]|uniref:Succinate-semialdehyde dehydrogenase [NADP(+)] GabD n=1 Tax=Methanorbis rubei TaxID=3028300 RepID=A0AAE4MH97_9EURY|nr:Succinate-semialdehyde dehydrogenase [NADP(+)] GabD [Methanocorpusculaceae archaeon Cs1]